MARRPALLANSPAARAHRGASTSRGDAAEDLAPRPEAFAAARAAVCAAEQGHFWEYHDALFASESLASDHLESAARSAGLEMKAFGACAAAERSSEAVVADVREAKRLEIATTPTFVVNGVVAEGALSFAQFQQIVNPELEAGASAFASPPSPPRK